MKIKHSWAVALAAVFTLAILTLVSAEPAAVPKTMPVKVDGKLSTVGVYNIDGNNYFKLRDVARILSGTGKQFDVAWNEQTSMAELISGVPYTATASDNAPLPAGNRTPNMTELNLKLDGTEYYTTPANIDGLNYFKIRDISAILSITDIGYEASTDTVILNTGTQPAATPKPTPTPSVTPKPAFTIKDYGFGQIKSFSTNDMSGGDVTEDIFTLKPITFINYWATWCGPCRSELPEFQAMRDKYSDQVTFITIIDDGKTAQKTAEQLIDKYLKSYINLLPAASLIRTIQTNAVPTSVIVDSGGYLVMEKIVGAYGRYDKFIDAALKKVVK